MNRKKLPSFIVAALLVWAGTVPAAYAEITLTLINEYPATSITATADLQFAKHVEKLSEGAIHVKTLHAISSRHGPYTHAQNRPWKNVPGA